MLRLAVFIQYRLVTDGEKDRQTQGYSICRACIASRGSLYYKIALSRVVGWSGDVTRQPHHWSIAVNRGHTTAKWGGRCLCSELTDGLPRSSLSAVAGIYKPSRSVGIQVRA